MPFLFFCQMEVLLNMKPKRLSQKLFLKSFEYAPRLAVNLLIKNQAGEILLTRRAIQPQKGAWHYPGMFLLKSEKISDCLARLFKDELGMRCRKKMSLKFLGLFENMDKDPRGHVIDALWEYVLLSVEKVTLTSETREVRFFKSLPRRMGFNHRDTINKVRNSLHMHIIHQ